ncbi:MAG: hypothetical protein P8Y16_03760 [Sulfurimonas sp.]
MILARNKYLKQQIEQKVDEIGEYYNANKGVILTETDLQCILYNKLLEIDILSKLEKTDNTEEIYTHYVHTEVSWFDYSGKLTLKPDISLISPSSLQIANGKKSLAMPTKGFYFVGGGIIFELKFNRYKSTKKFLSEIKKDFEKFEKLKELNSDMFCYFVVFNKTNNLCDELQDFIYRNSSSSQHKLIYKSGNL